MKDFVDLSITYKRQQMKIELGVHGKTLATDNSYTFPDDLWKSSNKQYYVKTGVYLQYNKEQNNSATVQFQEMSVDA